MRPSLRYSERGSIVVLTALALVILLGISALALDASYLYENRDRMGAAADAAARAAALELVNASGCSGNCTTLTNFGQDAAIHTDSSLTTSNVAINHPPTAGPFVGN